MFCNKFYTCTCINYSGRFCNNNYNVYIVLYISLCMWFTLQFCLFQFVFHQMFLLFSFCHLRWYTGWMKTHVFLLQYFSFNKYLKWTGVLLVCTHNYTVTRNTCTQQPLAQGNDMRMEIFSFSPCTFQETVGSHLKPSLPVVVMATLNQFNSNLFVVSVKNSPLAKISQYISIHT